VNANDRGAGCQDESEGVPGGAQGLTAGYRAPHRSRGAMPNGSDGIVV
jgi:hypothetical protein